MTFTLSRSRLSLFKSSANPNYQFAPPSIGLNVGASSTLDESSSQMPYDFLADTELNFDPQAFFNEYMFTGEVQRQPIPTVLQ